MKLSLSGSWSKTETFDTAFLFCLWSIRYPKKYPFRAINFYKL